MLLSLHTYTPVRNFKRKWVINENVCIGDCAFNAPVELRRRWLPLSIPESDSDCSVGCRQLLELVY